MPACNTLRHLALALLPSLFLAAPAAHAHSVALSSSSGNAFSYDVIAEDGTVSFYGGSTISMDGFSGQLVSVSLSPIAASFGTVSYSDSAIVFTLNENAFYDWSTPADLPLFTVLTSSNSLGLLYWTLNEADGSQRGTIAPATAASSGYPLPTINVTPLPASHTETANTTPNPDTTPASDSSYTSSPSSIVATPEPSSLILLGSGLVGAASMLRRRL